MQHPTAAAWPRIALALALIAGQLAACGSPPPLQTDGPRESTFGEAPAAAPASPPPAAAPTAVRVQQVAPTASAGGVGDYPTAGLAAPPQESFDPIEAMRNTTPQTVPMSEVQP